MKKSIKETAKKIKVAIKKDKTKIAKKKTLVAMTNEYIMRTCCKCGKTFKTKK